VTGSFSALCSLLRKTLNDLFHSCIISALLTIISKSSSVVHFCPHKQKTTLIEVLFFVCRSDNSGENQTERV